MSNSPIPDAVLVAYLDESLPADQLTQVELRLRDDDELRNRLRLILDSENRGVHTLSAIWRRGRVSCPSRELLGSYLLGVLEQPEFDYITFHLETIQCQYCQSSIADLRSEEEANHPVTQQRRSRYFESSAGRRRKD